MLFKSVSVLAATAATVAAATNGRTFAVNHFYGGPLTVGRMDPIISPGKASGHQHVIQGGSNFALTMSDTTLLQSSCTNSRIKNDKSVYWTPTLFFQDPTTKLYTPVDFYYQNVYYFFEATDDEIVPFPPGLRIFVGDSDQRTPPYTGDSVTTFSASDPSVKPQPIQWTCPRSSYNPPSYPAGSNGMDGHGIQDSGNKGAGAGFPDANCDGQYSPLRADIHFPSCYNPAAGLDDYKNNMVFPTSTSNNKQNCPAGYIHVPHMFYEVYWDTQKFADKWTPGQGQQPFVLSNGDSTGYSLHADFIAGWDEATLQEIINTCNAGDSGMENCPNVPGGTTQGNPDTADQCHIPDLIAETALFAGMSLLPGGLSTTGFGAVVGSVSSVVGSAVSAILPASTPTVVQSVAESPKETAAVVAATPSPVYAASTYTTTTSSSSSGWGPMGCYSDNINARVLSGKTFVAIGNHQVTSWACVAACDSMGFSMAGTEYGGQCFCGDDLVGSEKIDDSTCNMTCEGDANEICGGKAALSVFKNSGAAAKQRREVDAPVRVHRHLARHIQKGTF